MAENENPAPAEDKGHEHDGREVNVHVALTNHESGEVVQLAPGDKVPDGYGKYAGAHLFDEDDSVPDSEVGLVAGPSQGLRNLPEDDLAKARRAEASRRARAAKKAQDGGDS